MLSTLTHTHSPPPLSFKHFSSVFSQWCRIKLCPQRRQHRDGLSFLGFLGPTSKTQRLKLGISEQLESLFNYICGLQACHQCVTLLVQTPECCLLRGSQTGVKPMEAGVSNQNVHGDFAGLGTTLVTFTTNNWRSGKTIQWTEKKRSHMGEELLAAKNKPQIIWLVCVENLIFGSTFFLFKTLK